MPLGRGPRNVRGAPCRGRRPRRPAWRHTLSGDCRAACPQAAAEQTGVKAINAYVLADNSGSVRVLEKAGFVRTQVLEKAYEIDGVRYDDWVYRLECGAA